MEHPAGTTTRTATSTAPSTGPTTRPAIPTGPNIILIIVSDQHAGLTGFEGHRQVKTPNIDRLAADGLYFERCYTPTPLSGTSRACILTGKYPHAHGATAEKATLAPETDTFTALLKKAGYACGIVGKWDLPDTAARSPGFGLTDYVATEDQAWKYEQCPVWVQGEKKTADKFLTDWETNRAIEYVEKNKERPFFLWLAFRTNQDPLVYPPGSEKQYPPDTVNLPDPKNRERGEMPRSLTGVKAVTDPAGMDDRKLREARSKCYAMISRLDENIGRLAARLNELKLSDKTVVILTSDGGFALGDHGLYGRGAFFYDAMIRCPLLIRYPAVARSGGRCPRVVSLVDLGPTICEMAGLPRNPLMQGYSLVPLLNNPNSRVLPDERFLEYDAQSLVRGLVAPQYKFARYLRDSNFDVLYHLTRDPEELNNVGRPADSKNQYFGVIKVFANRVEQWRKNTRDPAK
jgi:arylsulfatase